MGFNSGFKGLMNLEFFQQIFRNTKISSSMKIHPVGAMLLHAGGWADRQAHMTKLIVAFHNFANAPKKWSLF